MSEETGNAGDTGDAGNNQGAGSEAITFATDADLQAHVDKTLNKRYAEINTKAEAKASETITGLQGEIAALKAGNKEDTGKKKEPDADYTAMQEKITQMEEREAHSLERNKRASILTLASELNAINGEQVAQLIAPNVKTADDGSFSVLNAQGQVLYSADSKPTTVREYVAAFLNDNPHLVRSSGGGGAGSQGAGPDGASGSVKFNTVEDVHSMSMKDLNKALADGVSIPGGGGQTYHFKTEASFLPAVE